jgi:hypothetical protein
MHDYPPGDWLCAKAAEMHRAGCSAAAIIGYLETSPAKSLL